MKTELKIAIFKHMANSNEFQLVNSTTDKFRQYIYDGNGEYIIGGEEVHSFIKHVSALIRL